MYEIRQILDKWGRETCKNTLKNCKNQMLPETALFSPREP